MGRRATDSVHSAPPATASSGRPPTSTARAPARSAPHATLLDRARDLVRRPMRDLDIREGIAQPPVVHQTRLQLGVSSDVQLVMRDHDAAIGTAEEWREMIVILLAREGAHAEDQSLNPQRPRRGGLRRE